MQRIKKNNRKKVPEKLYIHIHGGGGVRLLVKPSGLGDQSAEGGGDSVELDLLDLTGE